MEGRRRETPPRESARARARRRRRFETKFPEGTAAGDESKICDEG